LEEQAIRIRLWFPALDIHHFNFLSNRLHIPSITFVPADTGGVERWWHVLGVNPQSWERFLKFAQNDSETSSLNQKQIPF